MARSISLVAVVGMATLLAGCSATSNTLFPSLSGEDPSQSRAQSQPPQTQAIPPSPAERNAQPTLSQASPSAESNAFRPRPVTPGPSTGTEVGRKVQGLREDVAKLQTAITQENGTLQGIRNQILQTSQRYHATVGTINAKLQAGTTPGNPELVQKFNSALVDLDLVSSQLTKLNELSTQVAGSATQAAYLQETIQATYSLSGAVDEDHRQLNVLGDDLSRTSALIDRLQNDVSQDISTQANSVADERRNLNALGQGVKSGHIVGTGFSGLSAPTATGTRLSSSAEFAGRGRPLVVIRFDRRNVDYQQTLHSVVNRVLERDPGAAFDLVAVMPAKDAGQPSVATQARRNAEGVMRSLTGMGLSPSRLTLSATSSPDAEANEVRVYLR
ncbi:MAG TPA: hypothetical protein VFO61_04740 [Alphaproteobacteria bacterium]|nr:hypothetical protein [Alphaproteobacteria bacterium]